MLRAEKSYSNSVLPIFHLFFHTTPCYIGLISIATLSWVILSFLLLHLYCFYAHTICSYFKCMDLVTLSSRHALTLENLWCIKSWHFHALLYFKYMLHFDRIYDSYTINCITRLILQLIDVSSLYIV